MCICIEHFGGLGKAVGRSVGAVCVCVCVCVRACVRACVCVWTTDARLRRELTMGQWVS